MAQTLSSVNGESVQKIEPVCELRHTALSWQHGSRHRSPIRVQDSGCTALATFNSYGA